MPLTSPSTALPTAAIEDIEASTRPQLSPAAAVAVTGGPTADGWRGTANQTQYFVQTSTGMVALDGSSATGCDTQLFSVATKDMAAAGARLNDTYRLRIAGATFRGEVRCRVGSWTTSQSCSRRLWAPGYIH